MTSCDEARKTLGAADSPWVGEVQVEAALHHAEECPDCGRFLAEDRRIAQLIRDSVPRVPAPAALRARLETALARVGTGRRLRVGASGNRRWLVAALVVIGLGLAAGGHWLMTGSGPDPAVAFAEAYLERAVVQEALETGDRGEVTALFARGLGMAMPPPLVPEFTMKRAAIWLMDGRRGGLIEYQGDGMRLSYYVISIDPDARGREGDVDAARVGGPGGPGGYEDRGLAVAVWWDDEHQHALIGAQPPLRLRRLAPFFACPTKPL